MPTLATVLRGEVHRDSQCRLLSSRVLARFTSSSSFNSIMMRRNSLLSAQVSLVQHHAAREAVWMDRGLSGACTR
jgi:hypothetical protein